MRKILSLIVLASVGSTALAQLRGSDVLANYSAALQKLQSLSISYSVTSLTGLPLEYKVDLARPNRVRLDNPQVLILADGQDIYTYSKQRNAYYRRPQTPEGMRGIFSGVDVEFLAPFFVQDAFSKAVNPRSNLNLDRGGEIMNSVQFSTDDHLSRHWTLFFSTEDSMIRQGRYVVKDDFGESTSVVHVNSVAVDQAAPEAFAWSTPSAAREFPGDSIEQGRWFTDLQEAKTAAMLSQRILMVVVGSKSSGGTAGVERQMEGPRAKALATHFVYCKLSSEDAAAKDLQVGAMPTIRFFRWDGAYITGASGPTNENTFLLLLMRAIDRSK